MCSNTLEYITFSHGFNNNRRSSSKFWHIIYRRPAAQFCRKCLIIKLWFGIISAYLQLLCQSRVRGRYDWQCQTPRWSFHNQHPTIVAAGNIQMSNYNCFIVSRRRVIIIFPKIRLSKGLRRKGRHYYYIVTKCNFIVAVLLRRPVLCEYCEKVSRRTARVVNVRCRYLRSAVLLFSLRPSKNL